MLIPWGSIVNGLAIMAGSLVGALCGARLPERVRELVYHGLGMCVVVIGLQMALKMQNSLVMILSIVFGSSLGAELGIEDRLLRGGDCLKRALKSKNPRFTEGMVNASVLFCVGAMAILGSFDEGLRGDRSILYAKAVIDGFAAMAMAAAFGAGVMCSAFFVLVYQGILTLFASSLQPWMTDPIMNGLTATGGLLVFGIGLNMMELTRLPLANMLPSLVFVVPLAMFFG